MFDHTPVDLTQFYGPPEQSGSSGNTNYTYNLDRQIVQTLFSDSSRIQVEYNTDSCGCGGVGKPSKITFDRGTTQFKYSPSGNLEKIISPSLIDTLKYTYDGSLPKSVTWKGSVNGSVGVTYNNDFQVTGQTVNGGNSASFVYDNDGLLAAAGSLTVSRNASNGILTGTTLGNVTTNYSYNNLGELSEYSSQYSGSDLLKTRYHMDAVGRIDTLWETTQGVQKKYAYLYDLTGRLVQVDRNDTTISIYSYDSNGNRISHSTLTGTNIGIYDAQDRMLSYGNATFGYTATGSLKWKAVGTDTTRYEYDLLGNLVSVRLPNSTYIQYLIDGQNRRVAKIVNGRFKKRWLYQNQLDIVAELDSIGNVEYRFVYVTKGHVPDYMIRHGVTYRYITDHLGSVRLLVDIASGDVVQYLEYDEFGNILVNTNPGFQPFGYAGGLYDTDTKLIKYGARDYDSQTGRWTAKDPIGFGGGQINIYSYVFNNPINCYDPSGLWNLVLYGGGHYRLTFDAVNATNFNLHDYGMMQKAHRDADMPFGKLSADKAYHYHSNKGGGNPLRSQELVDYYLNEAVKAQKACDHDQAMYYLGMGLHILQDFYSHYTPEMRNDQNYPAKADHRDYYAKEFLDAYNASVNYLSEFTQQVNTGRDNK